MTGEHDDSAVREQRLQAILHAYLQAVDAGQAPVQENLPRQHPDLAPDLEAFFRDQGQRDRLAQSMRAAEAAPPAADSEIPTVGPESSAANGSLGTVPYFGDYELLEEIARGGLGVVYKARQVSLNRKGQLM
jgi:serine/threonine-protein kinase